MGYEEFLKSVSVFETLSASALAQVTREVQAKSYAAGEKIIRRGEPGDAMYIIVSGEVTIPIIDQQGKEKFVATLGPREFFGEMALLTGAPRSADVLARAPTETLVVYKESLEGVMRKHPAVSKFLTQILGERLLESDFLRQVGKYRLLGEIGRGGQAIVYNAVHPTLKRTVAIKMLAHELVFDEEFATRFRQEAEIIAQLEHENIVQVYDTENAYGTYFIIMEWVDGTPLDRVIAAKGTISADETREILAQLCSALDVAHRRGVVHRDIKPSNVMFTSNGRLKLMDFGIARVGRHNEQQKQEEDIIGTAEYMSPEQALGKPMDGRADLYSVGVMTFEMLTGRLPFESDDPYEVLRAHIRGPIPEPRSLVRDIPDDLNTFCVKSMQKQPDQRFRNLEDAAHSLKSKRGGFDPSRLGVKVMTLVYDKAEEPRVAQMVEHVRAAARAAGSGVHLAVADMDRLAPGAG